MAKNIPGVERLTPKTDTVRELYLKSGNQCAYPDCRRLIMNSDGVYVGELCHIEAAKPDGARFNKNMTNEERRDLSNLMLMCHEHHKITDDEVKYPVATLQQYKADHEAKFTDVDARILDAIEDKSGAVEARAAVTLQKLCGGSGVTAEMLEANCEEANWAFERLSQLPWRTRQLLRVIISRLAKKCLPYASGNKNGYEPNVLLTEIADACDLSHEEVRTQVTIMEKYGVATISECSFDSHPPEVRVNSTPNEWFIWEDIRDYCEEQNIPLRSIIEELRFDKLD